MSRTQSRWSRAVAVGALLLGLAASTTACSSAGEPVLEAPRTVSVPAIKAAGFGYPDLTPRTLRTALLDGPHYRLAIQWVATGEKLEKQAAAILGTTPVRAADGQQLLVAAVDPARAYAAFPAGRKHPVRVTLLVGGHATRLPKLPLRPGKNPYGPANTRVIEVSTASRTPVLLRAVDDGHTEELDLRTGRVRVDTYRVEQGKARWKDSVPVASYSQGRFQRNTIDAVNAVGAENAVASLTTYTSAYGWAPKGRAFLSVPVPRLLCGLTACIGLHEEVDDAKAFRFTPSHGRPIAAEKAHRDLTLMSVGGERPDVALVFEVPVRVRSGTVSLHLAAAKLTEVVGSGSGRHASERRRTVAWTRPPAPLKLHIHLTS